MGVDSRGKVRGECLECDCSDYETPSKGVRCVYCDCVPTKHQLTSSARTNPTTNPLTRRDTPAAPAFGNNNSTVDKNKNYFNDLPKVPELPSLGRARDSEPFALEDTGDDWATVEGIESTPLNSAAPKTANKPSSALPDIKPGNVSFNDAIPEPNKTKQQTNKKPDKVKGRENARSPLPTRRKGKADGKSGTKKPLVNPNRRKKSVATKVHNLDDIMSSHLSDKRTAAKIDQMFQEFDDDGSNELDRDECTQLTGYILEQCGLQPDIIPSFVYDEAFSIYDEDGGGTITLGEFREYLMGHLTKGR